MDQDVRKLQGLLYLYADKSRPYKKQRTILKTVLYAAFLVAIIAGVYGITRNNKIIHYSSLAVLILTNIIAIVLLANTIIQKHNLAKLRESCIDLYIERFVVKTLKQYFEDVNYDCRKSFTKKLIKTTQIFANAPPNIKYQFSGLLNATYDGVPFSLSHIDITQQQYGEDKKTVIMSGYWVVLNNSKKIDSEICILRKNTGLVGSRKVFETESNEFNRYYDVFSTNEKDIYYVLTPDLMEELITYRENYGTASFSFSSDRINILLDSASDFGLWFIYLLLERADGTISETKELPIEIDADKIDSAITFEYDKVISAIKTALNMRA